jgi:hypothetical protein
VAGGGGGFPERGEAREEGRRRGRRREKGEEQFFKKSVSSFLFSFS